MKTKLVKGISLALLLAFVLVMVTVAAGCGSTGNQPAKDQPPAQEQTKADKSKDWKISIGTAPTGGSYYIMGAAIADVLQQKGVVAAATAEATTGSVENVRLLGAGKIPFAVIAANWVAAGAQGLKPFESKTELQVVAPIQMATMWFVTLKKSPINSTSDLRGKRIAVGARNSGMEQHAQTMLKELGMTYDDIQPVYLDFGEGATALREGKVDAQLQDGLPNASMTELSELAEVKAVPFTDVEITKMVSDVPSYARAFLEVGAFRGLTERTPVIGVPSAVITMANADPDLVYAVAKGIIDNRDDLSQKSNEMKWIKNYMDMAKQDPGIMKVGGVPLHAGAEKAYREAGALK